MPYAYSLENNDKAVMLIPTMQFKKDLSKNLSNPVLSSLVCALASSMDMTVISSWSSLCPVCFTVLLCVHVSLSNILLSFAFVIFHK